MKKLFKYLLYRVIGKPVYRVVRLFYSPPESLRRRLRFIGKFRVRTAEGKKFRLYNNAFHLENHIFWLGLESYPWEQTTRRVWNRLCPVSATIFDIGANSGIYAVLAKVYNPESTVYAFEPQPNVYKVLCRNNQVNGFDIICEELALGNEEGRLPFYNYGPGTFVSENTTAGSLNRDWVTREQSSILVEVKKLATYIEEHRIPKIDLLKIDVETLEYEVLLGYGSYLLKHRPVLVLEIQNPGIGGRIASLLEGEDYVFFSIEEREGLHRVEMPGEDAGSLNYLLCPSERESDVGDFILRG